MTSFHLNNKTIKNTASYSEPKLRLSVDT